MKRHTDPHFFDCPNADNTDNPCRGRMRFIGRDLQRRDVFQCSDCPCRSSEEGLEREQRQRKMRD